MRKINLKKGFTVAEALIVVAIIAVLGAVAVIAVYAYMRSMTKLKYDGYAKEIFVAAQNHLSMAESQGYLGRDDFGTPESKMGIDAQYARDGVYCFVKSPEGDQVYDDVNDEGSVLNLMLPFAAVDETVRSGGCYVISYHKESATVLDVFYWQENDNFSHNYIDSDYSEFMRDTSKDALKNYGNNRESVIGYYGRASADKLEYGKRLATPSVVVENADKLVVYVTDLNRYSDSDKDNPNAQLKLIITGETSKKQAEIKLTDGKTDGTHLVYEAVLDDITSMPKHFYNQFVSVTGTVATGFIAGENITVQAVSYNNSELTNVAYSTKYTTNSLFAYNDGSDDAAHISYFRHFENLDTDISNVNLSDTRLNYVVKDGEIKARQIDDIEWDSTVYQTVYGTTVLLADKSLKPVLPSDCALDYNGGSHTLSKVIVNVNGNGGLFDTIDENDTVYDLKLIDFSVDAGNAGTLAGELKGGSVSNIIAYNTTDVTEDTVSGKGSVGGLIGKAEKGTNADGSVTKCAAALVVKSTNGSAGGLIGTVNGVSITDCYSGGHTDNGAYITKTLKTYNVTANAAAGGLVGELTDATVVNSYSTCSVKGNTAGGFIGVATNGNISKCYATGLIDASAKGAFYGTNSNSNQSSCWYYEIINESEDIQNGKHKGYKYLAAVGSGSDTNIKAFDDFDKASDNPNVYAEFAGSVRSVAYPYDNELSRLYNGEYPLVTADQLAGNYSEEDQQKYFVCKHYGDWPAPEVTVINQK